MKINEGLRTIRFKIETLRYPRLKEYSVMGGNASLKKSRVVFIGELHDSRTYYETLPQELTKVLPNPSSGSVLQDERLLQNIAKAGDVVIMEAVPQMADATPGTL